MAKSRRMTVGAVAAVAVAAGGGFGAWWITNDTSEPTVISAAAGAEARAAQALNLLGNGAGPASLVAGVDAGAESRLASDDMPLDCGIAEPYVPSAEELAAANADNDALVAVLVRYGIARTVITSDEGFMYVETPFDDMVANSVVASFWDARFPVLPPAQEDLDEVVRTNDVIAAALDGAGVSYTRTTDERGWEMLEWDYENPAAQEAVDAAYAELYPPQPPSVEELAAIKADNDRLTAAFDDAGVPYTRVSDELGWEWIEWDYEDQSLYDLVNAVFSELYPIVDCGTMPMDDMAESGVSTRETADIVAVDDMEIMPIEEFSDEVIALRDAEALALQRGMEEAGVTVRTEGESPWQTVLFDVNNDAAIDVVAGVLAARG